MYMFLSPNHIFSRWRLYCAATAGQVIYKETVSSPTTKYWSTKVLLVLVFNRESMEQRKCQKYCTWCGGKVLVIGEPGVKAFGKRHSSPLGTAHIPWGSPGFGTGYSLRSQLRKGKRRPCDLECFHEQYSSEWHTSTHWHQTAAHAKDRENWNSHCSPNKDTLINYSHFTKINTDGLRSLCRQY